MIMRNGRATDRWIAAAPIELPPLTGVHDAAQRILLLLHYSVDWQDSWVGQSKHRARYWDRTLPDYVISAATTTGDLHRFWTEVSSRLHATPRDRREREELAILLAHPDPEGILDTLREATPALVLRVRIIADAWRSQRHAERDTTTPATALSGVEN